jgi:hypothetical protein
MNLGIDKICLSTTDYQIKNLELLKYKPIGGDIIINKGGLLPNVGEVYADLKGNKIEAHSLYSNQTIGHYDISNIKGLQIHFNPSKVYHDYVLTNTGEGLNNCLKAVKNEADAIGIKVNLDNMKLIRLDIAKQQSLKLPLLAYHSAYNLIKGKRTETAKMPNGHYIGNKTHETCFYGKQQELVLHQKLKEYSFAGSMPPNLLRIEARLKNGKGVMRYTNLKNIQELSKCSEGDIENLYSSYLKNILFTTKHSGKQLILNFSSEVEFFNGLKQIYPRSYFNEWLSINGVGEVLNRFKDIETLNTFFLMCGEGQNESTKRKNAYMFTNRIKYLISQYHALNNKLLINTDELTPLNLLDELKNKFLNVA